MIRLIYFGTAHLNRSEDEVWLMPVGHLMDLIECHRQFHGMVKPKREYYLHEMLSGIR